MTGDIHVYRPDSDSFDSLVIDAHDSVAVLEALQNGEPLPTGSLFRWYRAEKTGDFPSLFQQIPVLGTRALAALRPELGNCCTIRDIDVEGETLHALQITCIADCLDRPASDLELFDGKIEAFERLAFVADKVPDDLFFKVAGIEDLELFCAGRLFDLIDTNQLGGLLKCPAKRVHPRSD